ncbi:apolipoprotein N-acyltransferase [Streptomyces longispororuber]|uniref:Apolipoprotein N-acyltransferase n=1 Tax=Streptomyces longispororuber TaxID=68230 RepID=A0A919ADW9_9ACTN|nr:apolipoprotein N-acyltransferase [Streptomyces longispororuber]GHE99886.1 apolipoprotein N-acyltransferase [Streptomyces longispororuber]
MTATTAPTGTPEQISPPAGPTTRAQRLRRRLLPAAGAVLSGVLLYLGFAPRELWWLAPFAFALLGLVLHGRGPRSGFALGLLMGLGYFLPLLSWTGVDVGPLPWLALAVAEALFLGLAGLGIALVSRLPVWPVWASGVWLLLEAARARFPFEGFPWGKVAFGQPTGAFLPLAALGGTPLLGFAVVLSGFGLADVVLRLRRAPRTRDRALVTAAVLTVAPVAAGAAATPLVSTEAEHGTATVAVVQGNVPRMGLDFNAQRRAVLDHHVRETLRLAEKVERGEVRRPDLVLWPENSSDIDPYKNADAYTEIEKAVKAVGAPVSVGAVVEAEDGRPRNRQILWDPEKGPGAFYDKRHLQPFGEYMPYRGFFRLFSSDVDRAGVFEPGTRPAVFAMAGTGVGPVTCYEAAFDDVVRDQVNEGAQILSVPSNNATFERSQMTYQQLAIDRVRAVEHGRAVLVPVTSGVSAVIRPDGTVAQRTGMFTAESLVAQVPKRSSRTLATRLGVWPEVLLAGLGVAGIGWAIARRRSATGG